MSAVLVTGAAGFVAFHVVSALLRAGVPVLGVDHLEPPEDQPRKDENLRDLHALAGALGVPFAFVRADLRDPAAFAALDSAANALSGAPITAAIHLAGRGGVRPSLADPAGYVAANLTSTLHLAGHLRERGVHRLVFASSSSVYGEGPAPFREDAAADRPRSPYAASKRAAELFLASEAYHSGMRVAAVRLFTVYGPRQRPDLAISRFAEALRAGEPLPVYGDGRSARDYTHADDAAAGILAALRWTAAQPAGTFEAFNLGSGRPISLQDLITAMEVAFGARALREVRGAQPGDVPLTWANLEKAQALLGYAPRVALIDGLRALAARSG